MGKQIEQISFLSFSHLCIHQPWDWYKSLTFRFDVAWRLRGSWGKCSCQRKTRLRWYLGEFPCSGGLQVLVFVQNKCNNSEHPFIMTVKIQNYTNRMLGYSTGQRTCCSRFGSVSSNFAMDDVRCTGNEASLYHCPYITNHNCGSHEGAGVICVPYGWTRLQHFAITVQCYEMLNDLICDKSGNSANKRGGSKKYEKILIGKKKRIFNFLKHFLYHHLILLH